MDIFLGSSQYWTIFRGHDNAFKGLFKVKVENGEYFLFAKISIFFGCLKFLIYFWGEL